MLRRPAVLHGLLAFGAVAANELLAVVGIFQAVGAADLATDAPPENLPLKVPLKALSAVATIAFKGISTLAAHEAVPLILSLSAAVDVRTLPLSVWICESLVVKRTPFLAKSATAFTLAVHLLVVQISRGDAFISGGAGNRHLRHSGFVAQALIAAQHTVGSVDIMGKGLIGPAGGGRIVYHHFGAVFKLNHIHAIKGFIEYQAVFVFFDVG